jgi:NAD(P)-dependent dehydrogenase (short-subunit alcohol dehydrogenase family)
LPDTVFITGAGRGIGRATAVAFAETGSAVFLADVCADIAECAYPLATREDLEETARRCRTFHDRVATAEMDVRRPEEVEAAFRRCRDELGTVDVLVNNAGVVGPAASLAHELSEQAWAVMLDIDLGGVWRCSKAALPNMVARRRGCVVNVASTAGLVAFPMFANYIAAKHGVVGLTKALALDYAPYGVRVNAVCPTSVRDEPGARTGMLRGVADMLGVGPEDYEALSLPHHPLGTLVDGADVAAAVLWLASGAAARVTGAVIPVDAGFTAR